jgi:hypothetical protein
MLGPAAGEQDDFIISKETSEASMHGLDWLQESIQQPALHLDSYCHGDVPNKSNSKTARGGVKRMED